MVEIIEDTNGDKLITLPKIEKALAEGIVTTYIKRGWVVENGDKLVKDIYFSDKRFVEIKLRLDKNTLLK